MHNIKMWGVGKFLLQQHIFIVVTNSLISDKHNFKNLNFKYEIFILIYAREKAFN